MGRRFTAVLATEWRGLLDWKWNSEQPLVFVHVVLKRTKGACNVRETQARINRRLDLWEKDIQVILLGSALVDKRPREVHVAKSNEEEED